MMLISLQDEEKVMRPSSAESFDIGLFFLFLSSFSSYYRRSLVIHRD